MPLRVFILILSLIVGLCRTGWAQSYISTCEMVPFACPTVCGGGTITLKIFQIQRLPAGSTVQAQLSDVNGTYSPGSQILPVAAYSTNGGSTYTNGPYTFHQDVSDLMARFDIPAGTQPGSRYTLRISSSSGYASADNFRCPGNGFITITASGATLPSVPQTEYGVNQWIGHVYIWNPTTPNPINTNALVNVQTFFDPTHYQGHVVYNALDIGKTFSTTGGMPGSTHDGTSIGCGTEFDTDYSLRLRRRQTFEPGYYKFTIGGDDGVRFSIDGGLIWLLSSFYDQLFSNSIQTTAAQYPRGICLNGAQDLVIEYFQHPQDAQLLFKAERLSPEPFQPQDQTVCGATRVVFYFGLLDPGGNTDPANEFRWQISTDGGQNFTYLSDNGAFANTGTPSLTVNTGAADNLDGAMFRCIARNSCMGTVVSNKAMLHVGVGPRLVKEPQSVSVCPGQPAAFSLQADRVVAYQWQADAGTGFADIDLPGFLGAQTPILTINSPTEAMFGWAFRCRMQGAETCPSQVVSDTVGLQSVLPVAMNPAPSFDIIVCEGVYGVYLPLQEPPDSVYWERSGDQGRTWATIQEEPPFAATHSYNLEVQAPIEGAFYVRMIINSGCDQQDTSSVVRIFPCCGHQDPGNVITPNGDGLNDVFGRNDCPLRDFSLQIYNRWGTRVFRTGDALEGWSAKGVGPGVYFYRLEHQRDNGSADIAVQKGTVEVVR